MLPAASHATSVGRLKLEPGVPSPGRRWRAGPAPRPGTGAGTGTLVPGLRPAPAPGPRPPARPPRGRTGIVSGLRPSTSATRPVGVELHDLAGAGVDRPDVVLRIDAQADRGVEAVDVLAQLAHELAVRRRTGTGASRRDRTCGCRRASRRDGRCACRRRSGPSNWRRRRRLRRRRRPAASSAGRRWCRRRSRAPRPARRGRAAAPTTASDQCLECACHVRPPTARSWSWPAASAGSSASASC